VNIALNSGLLERRTDTEKMLCWDVSMIGISLMMTGVRPPSGAIAKHFFFFLNENNFNKERIFALLKFGVSVD
jgi:hypothetical protein